MSLFYANRFVASLAITALTVTSVMSPVVAMANDVQLKSTYNVQSTQSIINTLTRLGGNDRYVTAVQIADHGWKSASTAVLAPSGDRSMVDALASSSLAKAVDGPILLAEKDSVPSSTLTELKKLGVTKVYLVSGTAVISAKVESELIAVGIKTVRLGGNDRYETALNIAKEIQKIKPFQEVAVTNANANVDAISIAPIAAAKGIPVLLVNKDSVPKAVSDFIKSSGIKKAYVIGGTAVVSDSVKGVLPNAMRLGGNNRFDTNTVVLKQFENLIVGGSMFFANGSDTNLVDSLTGAPMAAKFGGAIVLSNKEAIPGGTKGFIQTDISLKNPVILGGTAVMSDLAVQDLAYAQPGQSPILNGAVELNSPNATFKDKTVNGNILVDAVGEILQNVIVKGTVFVDPGKDGSTTLDGVQATKIVVLSGADHSIHVKNTKSDSLVVSSSSPATHVVAESGTTLGSTLVQSDATVESQSGADVGILSAQPRLDTQIAVGLQGTFANDVALSGSVKLTAETGSDVSNVKVTNSASPDAIQLAGQFASVYITDSSPVTLVSGTVANMATATASSIVVKQGAVVTNLCSSAGSATLSGGGTVNGNVTRATPTSSTVPVNPPSGGGSTETVLQATAETAVVAYEASPITTLAEVVTAEGLKVAADTAVAAVGNATAKTAFAFRVTNRANEIATVKTALLATALQATAETAVVAYEAGPITTLAEVATAEGLKAAADAAVAAVDDATAKTAFALRVTNRATEIASAKTALQVASGSISGTVTDSSGKALSGIDVSYTDNDNSFGGQATTDIDGNYTLNGLAAGTYNVQLDPSSYNLKNGTNWAPDAQQVIVVQGQTMPNIKVQLIEGGTMSGTVTDSSGKALSGIDVSYTDNDNSFGGQATTDIDGNYTLNGLAAGTYNVQLDPSSYNLKNGTNWTPNAQQVIVVQGQTMPNIKVQLIEGGGISGTVTDSNGKALSGIDVYTYSDNSSGGYATTDADGNYTLNGLVAGTYNVQIDPSSYNSQNGTNWAPNVQSVNVVQGQTIPSTKVQLIEGGGISGTVTDPNGKALSGIFVSTYTDNNFRGQGAVTDADGNYTLSGLVAGVYNVQLDPSVYNSQNGTNWAPNAQQVIVVQGQTMPNIKVQLIEGSSISGTVTDSNGKALSGVDVYTYTDNGLGGYATTDADGNYTLNGLATGTYNVQIDPSSYNSQNGTNWAPNAQQVIVVQGQTIPSTKVQLIEGSSISGTVTDSNGKVLSGVDVYTYTDNGVGAYAPTDADGNYTLNGLAAGTYDVQIDPSSYNLQNGTNWALSVQHVDVVQGQTIPNINAQLTRG